MQPNNNNNNNKQNSDALVGWVLPAPTMSSHHPFRQLCPFIKVPGPSGVGEDCWVPTDSWELAGAGADSHVMNFTHPGPALVVCTPSRVSFFPGQAFSLLIRNASYLTPSSMA